MNAPTTDPNVNPTGQHVFRVRFEAYSSRHAAAPLLEGGALDVTAETIQQARESVVARLRESWGAPRMHVRILSVTTVPADPIRERLEELRAELRAERISWGELHELQSLAEHIDPSDVELLEAAGVPEFPEEPDYGPETPGYAGIDTFGHPVIGDERD